MKHELELLLFGLQGLNTLRLRLVLSCVFAFIISTALSCSTEQARNRCSPLQQSGIFGVDSVDARDLLKSTLQRYNGLTNYRANVTQQTVTSASTATLWVFRSSSYDRRHQDLIVEFGETQRIEWSSLPVEHFDCFDAVFNEKPCRSEWEQVTAGRGNDSTLEKTFPSREGVQGVISQGMDEGSVVGHTASHSSVRYQSFSEAIDWLDRFSGSKSEVTRLVVKDDTSLLHNLALETATLVDEQLVNGNDCYIATVNIRGSGVEQVSTEQKNDTLTIKLWIRKSDQLIQKIEIVDCSSTTTLRWTEEHRDIEWS